MYKLLPVTALSELMRSIKLIARFYAGIFFVNLLITLSCAFILHLYTADAAKIVGLLFWFKLITIAVIFYSALVYKKKEFYYYQNLGVSKVKLGVSTSLTDISIWFIAMIIAAR